MPFGRPLVSISQLSRLSSRVTTVFVQDYQWLAYLWADSSASQSLRSLPSSVVSRPMKVRERWTSDLFGTHDSTSSKRGGRRVVLRCHSERSGPEFSLVYGDNERDCGRTRGVSEGREYVLSEVRSSECGLYARTEAGAFHANTRIATRVRYLLRRFCQVTKLRR